MKKRIELWGGFPNPVGGVSIHLLRLLFTMSAEFNIIGVNFSKGEILYPSDLIRKSKGFIIEFLRVLFKSRANIVHLHSANPIVIFVLSFTLRKRLLLTLHNKRLLEYRKPRKLFLISALKMINAVVINDIETYNFLTSKGIKALNIPAYICPLDCEKEDVPSTFIEFRKEYEIVVSMSIWNFNYCPTDIYGSQYIIPLLKRFQDKNIGFCLCISQIKNMKSFAIFQKDLKDNGLDQMVLILVNIISNGSVIWRESDVFLRPTLTDSEAISIKEALFYNIPVIASNVCNRPSEVIVYSTNNVDDLFAKMDYLLNNLQSITQKLKGRNQDERYERKSITLIRKLYSKMLNSVEK
jgi:glycosyltransferase involved in cell wall biosynthesis